ncbi:S-adenosyl-L-methionine-dependent methyltransferase [Rhodotorula diobovata]|uniref:S-adenosyl-L-methionine-dependent methyltransferase n=1 Tax=Rhodotorula diobovata TaxID=5288 RepID=A0A5C5FW05_9BASI|nr:S-adenosyl-L-methionine-dependent methyltransferase [Rhodotorula diobovata]
MSLDFLPKNNAEYGTQQYWDARYAQEDSFDWCKRYADVRHLIRRFVPNRDAHIVMLGCGNSTLSRDMYDDGYRHISNIDYSPVVIDKMAAANADCDGMTWTVGDIRALPFADGSVDVCIDKATMDAMLTGEKDPWNPPPEAVADCRAEVDEVVRVLRPDGIFLYLTFGQPHFRRPLLQRPGWQLEHLEVGTGFSYYFFWMRREGVERAEGPVVVEEASREEGEQRAEA